MVQAPAVAVRAEPAEDWSADGSHSERAVEFARRFVRDFEPAKDPRFRVTVEACPPEHIGLGVGTQLGMAVGKAVAGELDAVICPTELARAVGRGQRSAIGVHGFGGGGLIVDGGKASGTTVGARVSRTEWATDWRIVLARPRASTAWHGDRERMAFARSRHPEQVARTTERLCRLALFGLVPALIERDFPAFGGALYEFNRAAGEPFMAEQGGPYSSAEVEEVVRAARAFGSPGAGQSSWGPTVFSICRDQDEALRLASVLRTRFPNLENLTVTTASNSGADYVSD